LSDFRTSISIKPAQNQINYDSNILLIGSCFSENISKRLSYFKFKNLTNPYGILYNPLAIEKAISEIINLKKYTSSDLIKHNGLWHSLNHHSVFSDVDKDSALKNINNAIRKDAIFLKDASQIIITLGTSWVYRFIEKDIIVGNCHKIPQKMFHKELMSVNDILLSLESIRMQVRNINKKAHFILTVSPIRHLKDGFIENQLSKSNLIVAINKFIAHNKDCSYFPSYEIMLDDLRDYRFYKEDMIHPNNVALDYIWNKFKETWIEKENWDTLKKIDAIQRGLMHKPFNATSEQHQLFLKNLNKKIKNIQLKYPFMLFTT